MIFGTEDDMFTPEEEARNHFNLPTMEQIRNKEKAIEGLENFLAVWEHKEISWSDLPPELLERFKAHLYKVGIINELSYRNPWR